MRLFMNKWDARCRIISFTLIVFTISSLRTVNGVIAAFVLALLVILISGVPIRIILGKIRFPLLFLVPLFLFLPLTSGGEVCLQYSFITLYSNGLLLSCIIFFKTLSIISIFFVLMMISSFNETVAAMRSLKVPAKLINMLIFTYRYIFVYLEDLRKMRSALVLRGFRNRNNFHSLKSNANIIGSLVVRSYEQADRINNAMVLRGWSGEIKSLYSFDLKRTDVIKSVIMLLPVVLLAVVEMGLF